MDVKGVKIIKGFVNCANQRDLVEILREIVRVSPLFTPRMPRTGKPFSVRMTNMGELGWVSDEAGYRYQAHHPVTDDPWPAIDPMILDIWNKVSKCANHPQACLLNYYDTAARMGMHKDADEEDFSAPIVSISLGDTAVFRVGGLERRGSTKSVRLESGDVVVIGGDARLCYHGVDRIIPDTSDLLSGGGRINLTLRRVTAVKLKRQTA